jgi:DNA primase
MKNYSYNINKLLKKYNLAYKLSGSGKEVSLNCLWHSDEKGKLSINTDTGMWHCWVCREAGGFRELVKQIAKKKKTDINLDDYKGEVKKVTQVTVEENKISYPEGYEPLQGEAKDYILGRGITEEQIDYYRIGACYSGKYRGRIIVPVLNKQEELVSFIARDFTGDLKPKVLTPPSTFGRHGIKDYAFNLHRAALTGHLLIGEGVFDAISLGTRGICLFGKTATTIQIAKIINKKVKRITICLDPDAQLEANILANQLIGHVPDVRIVTLPIGTDPNSADPFVLKNAIANAKPPTIGYAMDFIGV